MPETMNGNHQSSNTVQMPPINVNPLTSDIIILDPLLTYIAYGLSCGTSSNVKNAILGFFTQDEIIDAKNTLYDKCCKFKNIIGDNQSRKDSKARTEKEAHLLDLINAISALDKEGKMPIFAVPFLSLGRVPKSAPEELNNISLADRLNRLENTIDDMKILMDRNVAENYSIKDQLKQLQKNPATFANVVRDSLISQSNAVERCNDPPTRALDSVLSTELSTPVSSEPMNHTNHRPSLPISKPNLGRGGGAFNTSRGRGGIPGRGSNHSNILSTLHPPNHMLYGSTQSMNSNNSDGRSGYQIPKYHQKKNHFLTGKKTAAGIRGAPDPSRFLFIYRVHSDTSTSDLRDFIGDQNVVIRSFDCVSHEEAKFKSFKLEVSMEDYDKIYNDELWPSGVRIRKYIPPRSEHVESW